MAARDRIHWKVRNALSKDGWTITNDPYRIEFENERLLTDLGAEQTFGAVRDDDFIAVEIKSFLGASIIHDFELALGQFLIYRTILRKIDPDRKLYLAVSDSTFEELSARAIVRTVLQEFTISVVVIDVSSEEVVKWID